MLNGRESILSKKYFLHLEGMDLAGKSTIAKLIAENSEWDWKIYHNCFSQNNPIQDLIKDLAEQNKYDDEIYGYLHFVALLADVKYFDINENVIQDSTILLRSINYHKLANNNNLVKLFERLVKKHPIPDVSIYLTVNIDERMRRLEKRMQEKPQNVTISDRLMLSSPEKFIERDYRLMNLSKKYFNSIVVDTSEISEMQTAKFVISTLKENINE